MADGEVSISMNTEGMSKGQQEANRILKKTEADAKAFAASVSTSMESLGSSTAKGLSKATKQLEIWNKRLEIAQANVTKVQEAAAGKILVSAESRAKQADMDTASGGRLSAILTNRRETDYRRQQLKKEYADYNQHIRQMNKLDDDRESHFRKVQSAMRKADNQRQQVFGQGVNDESSLLKKINRRAAGSPLDFQTAVKEATSGFGGAMQRQGFMAQGMSLEEAFIEQLRDRVGGLSAGALVNGGPKTPSMVGAGGSGGGKGGIGGILRRLLGGGGGGIAGSLVGGLASGIGIGVGGYALANAGGALIDANKQATAYERQMKAAEGLAGGQGKLNELMAEYNKDSGGAVSKTAQLEAVTRLLATGFAKTTAELGRFTRGSRGASIALGRPQEEVSQDVQLAISNTSKKRLDQIGLGIKEVDDRIEKLRKNNKGWQREQAFGEATLQLLDEKYGKLSKTMEGQATGLEKLASAWDNLILALGKASKGPLGALLGGLGKGVDNLAATVDKQEAQGRQAALRSNKGPASDFFSLMFTNNRSGNYAQAFAKIFETAFKNMPQIRESEIAMVMSRSEGEEGRHGQRHRVVSAPRFNEDQYNVVSQAFDNIAALEKSFNKQREDENRDFNQSMASMEKNYNKSRLREEQDFERGRARGLRDYNKSVKDAVSDAQDRDAQAQTDLAKSIAKMHRESDESIAKNEKEFQKEEERSAKQHRLAMLKSAGQLDAVALLDERLSYNEDRKQRKEDHAEQIKDAKDALAEQISDAEEAANDRLEQAHKEDKKRLDEMAFNYKQQNDDADADRALALARAKEDHDDEIAEAQRVHDEKMAQINQEEADRTKELNDALEKDLTAVGIYVKGYQEKLEARDKKMEEWFDKYLDKIEKGLGIENSTKGKTVGPAGAAGPDIPQYAKGGYVPQTGIAMLHAGEFVMPRALVASQTNSSSNRVVHIAPGAFQVTTTPGMEKLVGQMIEDMIVRELDAA